MYVSYLYILNCRPSVVKRNLGSLNLSHLHRKVFWLLPKIELGPFSRRMFAYFFIIGLAQRRYTSAFWALSLFSIKNFYYLNYYCYSINLIKKTVIPSANIFPFHCTRSFTRLECRHTYISLLLVFVGQSKLSQGSRDLIGIDCSEQPYETSAAKLFLDTCFCVLKILDKFFCTRYLPHWYTSSRKRISHQTLDYGLLR